MAKYKMKTKSGVKKRFTVTGSGKVRAAGANRRHNTSKRPRRMIRESRGKFVLENGDAKIVLGFMPYSTGKKIYNAKKHYNSQLAAENKATVIAELAARTRTIGVKTQATAHTAAASMSPTIAPNVAM